MSLWLNEILTQINNVRLLQNIILTYSGQEYKLQNMVNNPSALLSTWKASTRVCLDIKDFLKGICQL